MKITKRLLTNPAVIGPLETFKKAVVWHWIGNAGTNAEANRNWMNGEDNASNGQVSCTYIIGLYGECLQLLEEMRKPYTNWGIYNNNTITIECCHPDWTGEFTAETYRTMVEVGADICQRYGFDPFSPEQFKRHGDLIEKDCPRWFIDHPEKWEQFKRDVKAAMEEDLSSLPLSVLVERTKRGEFGNWPEREKRLGIRYQEVQAAIDSAKRVQMVIPPKTGDPASVLDSVKMNGGTVGVGEIMICVQATSLFRVPVYMDEYKLIDIKPDDEFIIKNYSRRANYVWATDSKGNTGYIYTPFFK